MVESLDVYLSVLALSVAVTVIVGYILYRSGRAMLSDVYDRRRAADVGRLVTVLYLLVVLGILAVIATVQLGVDGIVQTLVTKLGIVLLINAGAHGATMYLLKRIRAGRREEDLAEQAAVRIEQARVSRAGQRQARGLPPPRSYTPDEQAQEPRNVSDPQ